MLNVILAQAVAPPQATTTDAMVQLVTLVLLFAGMYFLVVVPQNQRRKQLEKLQKELSKGDKVIFGGGIYGTVKHVKDDRVAIAIDKDVVVEVQPSAILEKID